MLSDLRGLPEMFKKIKFEVGKPILPFQQLMSCLPPASSSLVPKPYRYLMTSPDSPVLDFYPTNFEVDMNGKKNPWEGVNLLPFIEIIRLLDAIKKHCPDASLSPVEILRNTRGNIYLYTHDLTCNETIPSPNKGIGLVDIVKCNSTQTVMPEYDSEGVSFKPELIPGTQIPYPGYPSLNVIPIASTELVPIGVNVFGMTSKYPTMVLKLHEMPQIPPVEALADNVLNKSLFINWPMMHEAKVVAISDEKTEVRMVKGKKKVKPLNKTESERWGTDAQTMMEGYFKGTMVPGSGGVQIGDIKVRLKLLPLQGMKTNAINGAKKKLFGKEEADVPLQLALWQAPAPDPRFFEKGPMKLQDRFPVDSQVVLTKGKYKGCVGSIIGTADDKKVGVKVMTVPPEIPFGLALARSVYESYISSSDAARILKLHPGLFGKITGSMLFEPGKYDLGLNLKSGDGFCVSGFTRQKKEAQKGAKKSGGKKVWDSGDAVLVVGSGRASGPERGDERIIWEYTPKAVRLVNEYRQQFPQLFTALIRMPNERKYDASAVFGQNGAEMLPKVREWLNSVESSKLPRTPVSTESMPKDAVAAVEKAADVRNVAIKKKGFPKESLVKIPGSALYRENSTSATDVLQASDYNDSLAPEVGDRIVNLCATGIPFGLRGTVVGIHSATTGCVEVVMDEEFVGGTNLQGLCSNFRGKLCVWAHVMRITVENSQAVVEKMVPQGSGRAAVDNILSNLERVDRGVDADATNGNGTKTMNQASGTPARNSSNPRSATSVGRTGSTGRPRPSSAGRDKQAGWREARGPPGKGNGFKGSKKGANTGLARWKSMVSGKAPKVKKGNQEKAPQGAAELKAMLGVGKPATTSSSVELKTMLGVGGSTAPKTTELKAMLGVPSNGQPGIAPQGAEAGLKALLGVGQPNAPPPTSHPSGNNGFPVPPPPPPPQPTAADKLLHLMSKQTMPRAPPVPPPAHSSFNFTYVEEGKEGPPPPAPQNFPMPPPHGMPMPYPPPPPVPMMMPAYGQVPMMQVPMMQVPMMQVPGQHPGMQPGNIAYPPAPRTISNEDFPPLGAQVSNEDFPPLGGKASAPTPPVPPVEPAKATKETSQGLMIPSNVSAQSAKAKTKQ